MLGEPPNRGMLAMFRLLVNPQDSLAWATLLSLAPGIGDTLTDYIYTRARDARVQFGVALLGANEQRFPNGPRSATTAKALIQSVRTWLDAHPLPEEPPENGWGHWMVDTAGGDEKKSRSETPAMEQKDLEDALTQVKARFDADANNEGEIQATITDAEDRLRMEQAKLGGLQDQLDRLDKTLESFSQQAGSNPH